MNNSVKKVLKNLSILMLTILLICLSFKLAFFYMPFMVAFALYLLIEPVIKFFMRKLNLKRKTCALIILFVSISTIIGFLGWGIATIVSETSNLLKNLNEYVSTIYEFVQEKISNFNFSRIQLSPELSQILDNSTQNVLSHISNMVQNFFSTVLDKLTSIPTVLLYIAITITSLYFMCTDKIYMIDQLEHHFPRKWVRSFAKHVKGIASSLGGYLKAQLILILVSFFINVVGLYILYFIGFDIVYPLLIAIGIAFVDALPILGSGTVMIPWAIIVSCKGDYKFSLAILVLWIIMIVVRQIMEPKVVGGQIGIHPIFTIIAMYTGIKFCGLAGLFIGPIILIILKNIFENVIDKGLVNSIVE